MSRNAESRFAINPTNIDIGRSTFDRSSSVKTSFNVGEIIPFYIDEVLPGDTFNVRTSKVVRLQTLLTPVMDNIYLDTYFFFVPNRLVWKHWKEFNGENTESAWVPVTEYEVPQIKAPVGGWSVGTIADYLGIPTGVANIEVSALPFRAYALCINEWFRDQNLQDPVYIPDDETTVTGVNTANYVQDLAKGGKPYIASKYHDYFTSALPAPQKGPDVTINLATSAPVKSNGPIAFDSVLLNDPKYANFVGDVLFYEGSIQAGIKNVQALEFDDYYGDATKQVMTLDNNRPSVYADLSSVSVATINQLRMAFQIQKLYEKDARGGTRYTEVLKSHFGVTSPDSRLQRPEYLGGNRLPINVNQVVQNSGTMDGTTPQGNVAGYSVTADTHSDFVKSFTEHGFVIGLCVARYDHTYQQGIERFWSRKDRFDYYWPVLANIGEQAILNKEIYAQGTPVDNEVFGYQEAWADYRYKPSRVSGEMRSVYTKSLDVWHLGDDYSALPKLSADWIREDKANVDRVLAVQSSVSNQLFGDFYIQNRTTRPMPLYSIPGLIDHH